MGQKYIIMPEFTQEFPNIYRLKIPFDNIYTSVFLIKAVYGKILVDCATTQRDVDDYIIPALGALGIEVGDISKVIITHNHHDHAGGLKRMLELNPNLTVINSVSFVDGDVIVYPMPGHTRDFFGVLDKRTGTLISGDGLQGAGVDKYRCSIATARGYLETLEKIEQDDRIQNILFSHAYEPWNCDIILGTDAVISCIEECKKYVGEIK